MAINGIVYIGTSYGTFGHNLDVHQVANLSSLGLSGDSGISGMCCDHTGNIYLADALQNIIIKIAVHDGVARVYAGTPGVSGNNGSETVPCASAKFNYPTGITCDNSGNVYVCDTLNNQIRKIDGVNVSLLAGSPAGASGSDDGDCLDARFNHPYSLSMCNAGHLYVADTRNHAVRRIVGSKVFTVCGKKGTSGNVPVWIDTDRPQKVSGSEARFLSPHGISIDKNQRALLSDTGNYCLKRVDPAGNVAIFSGSGEAGYYINKAYDSKFNYLQFSSPDVSGNLYVIDYSEAGLSRILKINEDGEPATYLDCFDVPILGRYVSGITTDYSGNVYFCVSGYPIVEFSSSSTSSSTEIRTSSSSSSTPSSQSSSTSTVAHSSSSSTSSPSSSSTVGQPSSSSSSSTSSTGGGSLGRLTVRLYDGNTYDPEDPEASLLGRYVSNANYNVGPAITFTFDGATFTEGWPFVLVFESVLPQPYCGLNSGTTPSGTSFFVTFARNNSAEDTYGCIWDGGTTWLNTEGDFAVRLVSITIDVCADSSSSSSP